MKENSTRKNSLVNAVTLARIPLTGFGIVCLYQYGRSVDSQWVLLFLATSVLVFFSDFIDGRLARRWDVCSDNGAKLDLFCDSFYIFASLLTMSLFKLSSPWVLLITVYKLFEFIALSQIKRKFFNDESFYYYDKFGRVLSALFYVTPVLLLILHEISPYQWKCTLRLYTEILFVLTIISSGAKFISMRKSFDYVPEQKRS